MTPTLTRFIHDNAAAQRANQQARAQWWAQQAADRRCISCGAPAKEHKPGQALPCGH